MTTFIKTAYDLTIISGATLANTGSILSVSYDAITRGDFSHVEVHLGDDADFVASTSTLVGTIASTTGGTIDTGRITTAFVALRAVNCFNQIGELEAKVSVPFTLAMGGTGAAGQDAVTVILNPPQIVFSREADGTYADATLNSRFLISKSGTAYAYTTGTVETNEFKINSVTSITDNFTSVNNDDGSVTITAVAAAPMLGATLQINASIDGVAGTNNYDLGVSIVESGAAGFSTRSDVAYSDSDGGLDPNTAYPMGTLTDGYTAAILASTHLYRGERNVNWVQGTTEPIVSNLETDYVWTRLVPEEADGMTGARTPTVVPITIDLANILEVDRFDVTGATDLQLTTSFLTITGFSSVVASERVVFINGGNQSYRTFDGTAWSAHTINIPTGIRIDGSLLVDGSITGTKILTNSVSVNALLNEVAGTRLVIKPFGIYNISAANTFLSLFGELDVAIDGTTGDVVETNP